MIPELPTLDSLRSMTSRELDAALATVQLAISNLHTDEQGGLRDLSSAQQKEFSNLLSLRDRVELHARLRASLDRGTTPAMAYGGTLIPSRDQVHSPAVLRMEPEQVRDACLRMLDGNAGRLTPEQGDAVRRTVRSQLSPENPSCDGDYVARRIMITESEDYRNAFMRCMTSTRPVLTDDEARALRALEQLDATRAMGEVTPSAGGLGVPALIDPTILLSSGAAAAPLLAAARVVPVTSNTWQPVSSAPVTFTFQTEAAPATDNSPSLSGTAIRVHMARGFVPYSIEVSQDYPGFATEIEKLLAQGWTDLVATKTITGTGTNEPWGILTRLDATTTSEVSCTTAGALGAVDIFNVWNQLPERFRYRSNWLMSVSVESQIRSFATVSAGQASSYFTTDLTQDGLTRLNGRPAIITDSMPAFTTATSHQNRLIVGDLSNYVIAVRQGLTVEPLQLLLQQTTAGTGVAVPTGQRGFFAWGRYGSDVVVANGTRLLNQT